MDSRHQSGADDPRPVSRSTVDDNPMNLKLARVTLAVDGDEVRSADDAEEAVWRCSPPSVRAYSLWSFSCRAWTLSP
jgi:hypothetical protein